MLLLGVLHLFWGLCVFEIGRRRGLEIHPWVSERGLGVLSGFVEIVG